METTLYNHKQIGEKPTIPNVIFKGLVWLVKNRFYEECQYLMNNYSLTSHQKNLYQRFFKEQETKE